MRCGGTGCGSDPNSVRGARAASAQGAFGRREFARCRTATRKFRVLLGIDDTNESATSRAIILMRWWRAHCYRGGCGRWSDQIELATSNSTGSTERLGRAFERGVFSRARSRRGKNFYLQSLLAEAFAEHARPQRRIAAESASAAPRIPN